PSPLARADGKKLPVATMRDLVEGQVRAEIARIAEALHLRSVVDRRLDAQPDAQLVVCGDFNDTPRSLTVRVVAGDGAAASRAAFDQAVLGAPTALAGRALHACGDGIQGRAETIAWRGIPETIDHMLVSESLWSRFEGASVHNERLGEVSAALGAEVNAALESDHAPMLARFV
ncbi:MAG: endonuclease/exonuclease/phosphatase family protein, partial [Deltaproteobacteria bacterium]